MKEILIFFFFFFPSFLFYSTLSETEVLTVKIVEDIDNTWANNLWNQPQPKLTLEPKVREANFSGPPHFKSLLGKCFEKVTTSYKYVFCPFHNVTQHEISLQWKPYNGILGVWQEWEIENNTFTAMLMKEGDKCGTIHRSVRVVFTCALKNEVSEVSEPSMCHYLLQFKTPLVCQKHSMFVYPYISDHLKDKWDQIEGEFLRKEVTLKGYNKQLSKILTTAGFLMSDETRKNLVKKTVAEKTSSETSADKTDNKFDSLQKCSAEYSRLQAEIEGLRTLISLTAQSKHQDRIKSEAAADSKKEFAPPTESSEASLKKLVMKQN